jgi:hypothetical protein
MDRSPVTKAEERLGMCIVVLVSALAIENLLGDLLGFAFVAGTVWAVVGFLRRKGRKP